MIKLPLKPLTLLAIPLALCATLNAATTTDPVGVVKITIAGTGGGSDKLTAISATLTNSTAYQGAATSIEAFSADSQPLETGVATWSATEWTAEPHLCYIENAAGAEEAYLITANGTDGVLTLATTFDISSRYTSTPNYRIVKAHTLGSLFGSTSSSVKFKQHSDSSTADVIYLWNGAAWNKYWFTGTFWLTNANPFSAENTAIFPDEGMFILRRETSDLVLTFNGSVPTKAQVSTIPGNSSTFLSTRYPVDTTIANLGLINLPNWITSNDSQSADRLYMWNGSTWDKYWNNGSVWLSTKTPFAADNDVVPADTAIFVSRMGSATDSESANTHAIPYAP